jgi:hypothetical protein
MMSLPNSDFLGTIVGVSATFIGFSLVVGFLRADDAVVGGRLQSMRAVAELAMIAGGGALLPLLICQFDVPDEVTWRVANLRSHAGFPKHGARRDRAVVVERFCAGRVLRGAVRARTGDRVGGLRGAVRFRDVSIARRRCLIGLSTNPARHRFTHAAARSSRCPRLVP